MRSVADELRREDAEEMRAKSPAERVALARSLFERDLAVFMGGQNVSREAALQLIEASRQKGRRRSRCMQE